MGREQYTAEQFIKAIAGSGGIVTTISNRVGCTWNTAQHYIDTHPTVRAAYDAECESILDLCESVVFRNAQIAQEQQRNGTMGDTADAKWILSRKGKKRGWGESLEVGGKGGGPLIFKVIYGNDGTDDGTDDSAP